MKTTIYTLTDLINENVTMSFTDESDAYIEARLMLRELYETLELVSAPETLEIYFNEGDDGSVDLSAYSPKGEEIVYVNVTRNLLTGSIK